MELLESQLNIEILDPLNEATSEGLVTNSNGSFHFCHDRIQEASLNLMNEHDRRKNHLAYGKCLVKVALDASDNDMFFTAVEQINMAGPSAVTDHGDYFKLASYNMEAGKRAISMADFRFALSRFENGIQFLRDGHWQDHYAFSLEIYQLACKSAVAASKSLSNDMPDNIFLEQVLKNARSFEDTVEIRLLCFFDVALCLNAEEILKEGVSILSKLGEEVPNQSEEAFPLDKEPIVEILQGLSYEHLLNYKVMNDTTKMTVMKVLSQTVHAAIFAGLGVACMPFLLKMLQITISYGKFIAFVLVQYYVTSASSIVIVILKRFIFTSSNSLCISWK